MGREEGAPFLALIISAIYVYNDQKVEGKLLKGQRVKLSRKEMWRALAEGNIVKGPMGEV
jgi:hypothetical protein